MKPQPQQLALREWGADIRQPQTLAVLGGIAAVLGLTGPFDTDTALRFIPRLAYWIVTVFATYSAGHIASGLLNQTRATHLPRLLKIIATGVAIGVLVAATVLLINLAAFGIWPRLDDWPGFLVSIFGISLVIATVFDFIEHSKPASSPDTIPLLDRLPFDKRGPLVAISVEDHYVRITTTKGYDMILMRLSDAIREVGSTPGLQTHRSHWVATDAVTNVTRTNDRATLTMTHGADISVSRANMPKLREAGLLPK